MSEPFDSIRKVSEGFREGSSIEEIEAAWGHVDRLSGFIESYHRNDKALMETLRRLRGGLSTFAKDKSDGAPSPYRGWRPTLSHLESQLRPRFGADGWPTKR